jgi:hypothetical protein
MDRLTGSGFAQLIAEVFRKSPRSNRKAFELEQENDEDGSGVVAVRRVGAVYRGPH